MSVEEQLSALMEKFGNLQVENERLKKEIDFMAQENNQICSDFQNYRSLYGPKQAKKGE